MKALFKCLSLVCLTALFATSCYQSEIDNLQKQIDQISSGEISSISSQVSAINNSIADLKAVYDALKGNIDDLKNEGTKNESQIKELSEMAAQINSKISELESFTKDELKNTKDWVNGTFATLEQYDALCQLVAGISSKLDGFDDDLTKALSGLETSMKKWVNEQLSDYYTIAQVDAALDLLAKADADLAGQIKEQKEALGSAKTEITEAYTKAIKEAIESLDGKISAKIAADIAVASKALQDQIDDIKIEINDIKDRLDDAESRIATIDEQIANINSSIGKLQNFDSVLSNYITAHNGDIASLEDADELIRAEITDLKKYVDDELKNNKDWANATFATLDQFDSLCVVVATISATVDEQELCDSLAALETSMKGWVNSKLADYYTIAQIDATLDSLSKAHDAADAALQQQINAQSAALQQAKTDITTAYQQAIVEAINNLKGEINTKIAQDIATAKQELQAQIDTINNEITSIKSRLATAEANIESLLARIQSIEVVPSYDDGSVKVNRKTGESEISFEIRPTSVASALASAWQSMTEQQKSAAVSFKIISVEPTPTLTATNESPSASVQTVSFASGVFNVGVKFSNLPEKPMAMLQLSYKTSDVTSKYFNLTKYAPPIEFSVSATKKVSFAPANLYWDGSDWHFEANQYTKLFTRTAEHVGHFYYAETAELSYGKKNPTNAGAAQQHSCFFAEENGGITVDGQSGYYLLSQAEWNYLFNTRPNCYVLQKLGVTVNGNDRCTIIAPDGWDGTIADTYTLEEWTAAQAEGLVCLTPNGRAYWYDDSFNQNCGEYLTSTEYSDNSVYRLYWYTGATKVSAGANYGKDEAYSVRLVKNITK